MFNPPIWGKQYEFYVSLVSQADTKLFQSNPTLASGDVKIAKDGGAKANLGTLPDAQPDGSEDVRVIVSATEMQADNVKIVFHDASGAEWCDLSINIQPTKLVVYGTVDGAGMTPTSTQFDTSITEATGDHYKNRLLQFVTGSLAGEIVRVSAYALVSGRGRFTVTATPTGEAPAANDAFVLL